VVRGGENESRKCAVKHNFKATTAGFEAKLFFLVYLSLLPLSPVAGPPLFGAL
jgi:hypothetical protein